MRRLRGQLRAEGNDRLRVRATEQENELALLAQFMRHDSVASLANAIAERTGVRSGDLIASGRARPTSRRQLTRSWPAQRNSS
jgi:hypothetical protein